jgi:hypothetical protein
MDFFHLKSCKKSSFRPKKKHLTTIHTVFFTSHSFFWSTTSFFTIFGVLLINYQIPCFIRITEKEMRFLLFVPLYKI